MMGEKKHSQRIICPFEASWNQQCQNVILIPYFFSWYNCERIDARVNDIFYVTLEELLYRNARFLKRSPFILQASKVRLIKIYS